MKSDIEIAKTFQLKPISQIAESIGINTDELLQYGPYKAKITMDAISRIQSSTPKKGKLILVSAITPTPAGEGKTTTSIGLTQGLRKLGKNAIVALREPSLGPVFGIKGGAAGGGYSQVLPMEEINLHFTGDMHAITAAHNLIAAALDNHLHFGNKLSINTRRVLWNRVMDMNDRALRNLVIGLGGKGSSIPRECSFDITAASEVMAVLCLSKGYKDLKEKLGNILLAQNNNREPVKVKDLGVEGAAAALLKEAILPNLVQTGENGPALIHGGPFANIAQGANSIMATNLAINLSDYAVTEAGFGFDLGAEKFFDIVSPYGGFNPSGVVLVATVRALKMHGGVNKKELSKPNPAAVAKGGENLEKHLENIGKFGVKAVVAINRFPTDTDEEIKIVEEICKGKNTPCALSNHWAKGGDGAIELAEKVISMVDGVKEPTAKALYSWDLPVKEKISTVAKEIYGAQAVDYTSEAKADLKTISRFGFDHLPVCIAKTQSSLSDNPKLLGRPKDFLVTVRKIVIAGGAGFLVPLTGDILRMPGLPRVPAAENMDISETGEITGLF